MIELAEVENFQSRKQKLWIVFLHYFECNGENLRSESTMFEILDELNLCCQIDGSAENLDLFVDVVVYIIVSDDDILTV